MARLTKAEKKEKHSTLMAWLFCAMLMLMIFPMVIQDVQATDSGNINCKIGVIWYNNYGTWDHGQSYLLPGSSVDRALFAFDLSSLGSPVTITNVVVHWYLTNADTRAGYYSIYELPTFTNSTYSSVSVGSELSQITAVGTTKDAWNTFSTTNLTTYVNNEYAAHSGWAYFAMKVPGWQTGDGAVGIGGDTAAHSTYIVVSYTASPSEWYPTYTSSPTTTAWKGLPYSYHLTVNESATLTVLHAPAWLTASSNGSVGTGLWLNGTASAVSSYQINIKAVSVAGNGTRYQNFTLDSHELSFTEDASFNSPTSTRYSSTILVADKPGTLNPYFSYLKINFSAYGVPANSILDSLVIHLNTVQNSSSDGTARFYRANYSAWTETAGNGPGFYASPWVEWNIMPIGQWQAVDVTSLVALDFVNTNIVNLGLGLNVSGQAEWGSDSHGSNDAYFTFSYHTPGGVWAPTFTSSPGVSATLGINYSYAPTWNETVTMAASTLPGWASIDPVTGEVWGTPMIAGVYQFMLEVISDAGGLEEYQWWNVTAAAGGGGYAPTFSSSPITDGVQGYPYAYHAQTNISDVDVTYTLYGRPDVSYLLYPDSTMAGVTNMARTPGTADWYTYLTTDDTNYLHAPIIGSGSSAYCTLADLPSLSDVKAYSVTVWSIDEVSSSWVNHTHTYVVNPQTGLPWTSSEINALYFDIDYSYNDGHYRNHLWVNGVQQTAWFDNSGPPANGYWDQVGVCVNVTYPASSPAFSVDPQGYVNGTPSDVGVYHLSLKAHSNIGGEDAWQNWSINVRAPWAPTFTSSPSLYAATGASYQYMVTLNESVILTCLAKPSWATWSAGNDTLWGVMSGSDVVNFQAQSVAGMLSAYQNFTINLVVYPTLTIDSPGNQTVHITGPSHVWNIYYNGTTGTYPLATIAYKLYFNSATYDWNFTTAGWLVGASYPVITVGYGIGTWMFELAADDDHGNRGPSVFISWTEIPVPPSMIITTPSPGSVVAFPYSLTASWFAVPGTGTIVYYEYRIYDSGAWGAWSAHTSALSHTYTATTNGTFAVRVTDSLGYTLTKTVTYTLGAAPPLAFTSTPILSTNGSYAYTMATNWPGTTYTYIIGPPSLSVTGSSLHGTPLEGHYQIQVQAHSTTYGSQYVNQSFSLTVLPHVYTSPTVSPIWQIIMPFIILIVLSIMCSISREGISGTIFLGSITIGIFVLAWAGALGIMTFAAMAVGGVLLAVQLFRAYREGI